MQKKEFDQWFRQWKSSNDAYRIVDRYDLQSLAAGACDALALAIYWSFPKNVTGLWKIQSVSTSRVDHVFATLRFDGSDREYGVDMDLGVRPAYGFSERWTAENFHGQQYSYLTTPWDTLTPIDKPLSVMMSAARELSASMRKSIRRLSSGLPMSSGAAAMAAAIGAVIGGGAVFALGRDRA